MIRDNGIENPKDSIYASEECHVHAIAAARVHGTAETGFLVIIDRDEPWWESPNEFDDDIPGPVHVYSLHRVGDKTIARDVFGDRLEQDAMREAAEIFCLSSPGVEYCDINQLLAFTDGYETAQMCKNGVSAPLYGVMEEDICKAMKEESVKASLVLNVDMEEFLP